MNAPRTPEQLLFESLRHTVACKHTVPAHLTEMELKFILNLLKQPEDRE